MTSITICQVTSGNMKKKKTDATSVAELRQVASDLSHIENDRFRLTWQGSVLKDSFDVCKLSNSLVMVVPMAVPQPSTPFIAKPDPIEITEGEIQRFRLAFGSAIRSPAFSKVVKRMLLQENMESLAAACPGLQQDTVAQAYLTRPELLIHLLDMETLKKISKNHPSLLEAANNLAAAVHEENAAAGRENRSSSSAPPAEDSVEGEPGSYFLDEMSDEDMDVDDDTSRETATRAAPITPEQLAAALATAADRPTTNPFMGVTGMAPGAGQQPAPGGSGNSASNSTTQSTATTPGALRITADMFQTAMQQAMMNSISGATSSESPTTHQSQASLAQPNWSAQLATMQDMGIVDEGLAVRALQVMGGDLQAAVDLIFSGWLGDDNQI